MAAGDPEAILNAVVGGPAVIVDGVLNGYDPTQTPRLLSPGLGIISVFLTIRNTFVEAITPPEPPGLAANATTSEAAATVTVDLAQNAEGAEGLGQGEADSVAAEAPETASTEPEDPAPTDNTGKSDDADLVRNSLVATPGVTATDSGEADQVRPLRNLRDGISGAVDGFRNGVRNFTERLSGKSESSSSSANSSSSSSGESESDSGTE